MKFGAHVSAAGGIFNAPENAARIGCEAFQLFTRSPQGGQAPVLTDEVVAKFKAAVRRHRLAPIAIHTPYYINFASTTPRIRYGSISVVREELERGTCIGADFVVTHLGSAKAAGPKLGFHKTWRSLQRILGGYHGSTRLLLEISAGAGDLVGDTFDELGRIIQTVERRAEYRQHRLGVCFDTCHAFASGYDLRTPTAVTQTLRQLDRDIGLTRLRLLHGNDSKFGLGEHRDRHEHIGLGKIGRSGFRAIVNHPKLKSLAMIIETPQDGRSAEDLKTLKRLRAR